MYDCLVVCVLGAMLIALSLSPALGAPRFALHGRARGRGLLVASIMGSGPKPGATRLYASYAYSGGRFDIVAIDPLTGSASVFTSPIPRESVAWGMVVGPDKRVYIGTAPTAHILRVDWAANRLVDLGRPSATEQNIWQLTVGTDGKIYGGTYPNAKLVCYDPRTGRGEDLGRMSRTQNYARTVAADDKGFVYVGIGTARMDLVAYDIATGKHRSILPHNLGGHGYVQVQRGVDGNVYARAGNQWLKLAGFTATPMPYNARPVFRGLVLPDGRKLFFNGRELAVHGSKGTKFQHTVDYSGKHLSIFRFALGPDGMIYGSTVMPASLFRANPEGDRVESISTAGSGEIYSLLPWRNKLIFAGYAMPAPIMIYNPDQPWRPGVRPQDNPREVHFKGENSGWRPMAMVAGPRGRIYIGAVPGYGLLGGPLCVLDPVTGKVHVHNDLVRDQSIVSLAVARNGLIVGGTSIVGGGGAHPDQTDAKVFLWDPLKRKKVFEAAPVPGQDAINALGVGHDGLIYGFAGNSMFVLDPARRRIIASRPDSLGRVIYNAIGRGPGGRLYGLCSRGIFTIDEQAMHAKLLAAYPGGVNGGFAIRGRNIYFSSKKRIVSYSLPTKLFR